MQWLKCAFLLVILSSSAVVTFSKNVLIIDGFGSPSHQLWMHRFARGLADHGYNVTSLSCRPIKETSENLHAYHLDTLEKIASDDNEEDFNLVEMSNMKAWQMYLFISSINSYLDKQSLKAKGFLEIMNFPEDFKFDLIIIDYISPNPLFAVADRFPDAQLIGASAWPSIEFTNLVTHAPNFASFIPNTFMTDMEDTFCSRLENFLVYIIRDFIDRYYWFPQSEKALRTFYQPKRSLLELYQSMKIQLVNYNPAVDYVSPIMPGVIPVGGLQIEEPKPLPKDLEEIFSLPSKGVVLFSLGTNVKSEMLGEDRLKMILSALAELPDYTFIWKIDLSKLKLDIPKNVFIKSWLPQNDILADNRTRLFISHAGGLSTQEATWHGQPMLALPIMTDQFPNAEKAVKGGMALQLQITNFDEATLKSTLLELLNNKKYSDAAKLRSKYYRDQKETPMERALWWVDYIVRNPDVSFLKNPKLEQMNYFVKHSMDVIAFLTIICLIIILLTMKIIYFIVRKVLKKGKIAKQKTN